MFPLLLIFALAVTCWAVSICFRTEKRDMQKKGTSDGAQSINQKSSPVRLIFSSCGSICLVLFIPTGTLVTAGFTFNETFIYWFPNFGFSFLLLTIILLSHFVSKGFTIALQAVFFTCSISCIFFLALVGLINQPDLILKTIESSNSYTPFFDQIRSTWMVFCTLLLLFLGYDQTITPSISLGNRIAILLTGALIISLWCIASIYHVEQQKLADSTIPYILGAREIFGQQGRIIMGIAIISGACSVVNGLFIYTQNILQRELKPFLSHALPLTPLTFQRMYAAIVSVGIGLCMATGLAGEEKLETYIFGSLLFWLLYTNLHLSAVIYNRKRTGQQYRITEYFLPLLLFISFFYLASNYHDFGSLLVFFAVVFSGCTIFTTGWIWYCRKANQHQSNNLQGDAL